MLCRPVSRHLLKRFDWLENSTSKSITRLSYRIFDHREPSNNFLSILTFFHVVGTIDDDEKIMEDAAALMVVFASSGSVRVLWIVCCLLAQGGNSFLASRPILSKSLTLVATANDDHHHQNDALTTALLRVSYDGGRFTGWSAANDPKDANDTDSVNVSDDSSTLPPPLLVHTGRKRRRRAARAAGRPGFVRSVQGVIQNKLAKLYGNVDPSRIVVEGCSRTDKGVHAQSNMVQVYCLSSQGIISSTVQQDGTTTTTIESSILGKRLPHPLHATDDSYFLSLPMTLSKLGYCLNRMLPADIRVLEIAPGPSATLPGHQVFHPTLSSVNKTYHYTVSTGPFHDPTQYRRVWHVGDGTLNVSCIQEACAVLRGEHNFAAFQGAARGGSDTQKRAVQSTLCMLQGVTIEHVSSWLQTETYVVTVTGDRFLYKMMRFLVGALVAVGYGQLAIEDIMLALETGNRGDLTWQCAPAHGLVLQDVSFDVEIDWKVAKS